jgi:uncharacterized protein YbaP (TraB family)
MEAPETAAKTTIRPNIANMVKTAGGSYHKDDFIGTTLNGLTVAQVNEAAMEAGIDPIKYAHLNPGQQRMAIGNRLRALTKMVDETGLEGAALDAAIASNKAAEDLRDTLEEFAGTCREENAAKPAKSKNKGKKVADDANGEGDTPE